ncbi:tRNase Z TRZ3, mitochondrial-like isoform X1 [Bidens hawaiensis]|uniref:tRNase Z TRZ3, mitochondrial-like isoform X1 n=1 Tax=Bidens hawaiensis TaxID=980011 RepID=UPI00404B9D57
MMPQITTNLRTLFPNRLSFLSSLNPNPISKFNTRIIIPFNHNHPLFTCSSSVNPRRHNSRSFTSNRKPMKTDDDNKKVGLGGGFNKKRAEGKDKSSRPKDLKLKVRRLNPVNTISYLQILGTGMDTQDTSPSVLLFFDKQRFIFNAGEGLQRFCTEHKIKLSKIDHIFLSRVCSETAGGLPGLLLTLAGTGEEGMSVNVWGPSDFKYLVDAMKSFIPNAAMVHTRCFGPSSKFDGVLLNNNPEKVNDQIKLVDDEVVKISAVLLRPETGVVKDESATKSSDISVLYICELPEIRGKFDPEKARALGLRPGPKYRELQEGISVKSDLKDIMIHPDDVLGPSVPGPIVLLVDCPTRSHFEEILSSRSLENYYSDTKEEKHKIVNCVIHLSPSLVVNSSDYQKWMSRFGGAQHIIAGHQMKNIEIPILQSSARVAARLNYLCPQFFPAPGFWSLQQPNCSNASYNSNLCKTVSAENLLKFHLRPYAQLGLDKSGIPIKAGPNEIINDLISELPEISDAAKQVSELWECEDDAGDGVTVVEGDKNINEEPWINQNIVSRCLENITREDVEIVLLGTGSSQPSKYRNVSSIFINLFSKGSLLLDCGEGTLGQLKRRFGIQGADNAVKGLKCIWISHIHADHHTGLARILTLRRDLLKGLPHEPLIVIGPRQLKRFLDAYERLEDLDMQFLDCRHTTQDSLALFESNYDNQLNENKIENTLFSKGSQMQSHWKKGITSVDSSVSYPIIKNLKNVIGVAGLENVISFPVVHCPQAFGVVLKGMDRVDKSGEIIPGWKIVYSGDTRPCPELVEASRGATVLIHEATFEDALVEEAIARNHSTTAEAIEMGNSAGAYRIVLTHFSQRYPKIPVFDESYMHKTCIAFDMMSINFADLHVLPRVLPYLKLLFKNEMIVDESDDVEDAVTIAA